MYQNMIEQSNWAPQNQPVIPGHRLKHNKPMLHILDSFRFGFGICGTSEWHT